MSALGPECPVSIDYGCVETLPALDIQLDRTFAGFEALRDAVPGESPKARLSWPDFAHVAERDLIARVLRGAAERGAEALPIVKK